MKKIIASLCAFALAASLPLAAFAAENSDVRSSVYGTDNVHQTVYGNVYGTYTQNAKGEKVFTVRDSVVENLDIEDLTAIQVTGASVSGVHAIDKDKSSVSQKDLSAKYTQANINDFNNKVKAQGGTLLGMVEINGTVDNAEKGATIAYSLPELKGHTVKVVIMHTNGGGVEVKTLKVDSNGILNVPVDNFSVFALVDVTGPVRKSDVGSSPQTGF